MAENGSDEKASIPRSILVVDIGGTKVKLLATGKTESRKIPSGPQMNPLAMVEAVRAETQDWEYDAVSMGYPGLAGSSGPTSEPGNLAPGWVGFDFAAAFERPIRILNDAALQALGAYEGGRMAFLGLGTGLGSTLISQSAIVPLELGCLPHPRGRTYGETLGRSGLRRIGKKLWRKFVAQAVHDFSLALQVDYIVLGGGNAKLIKIPPAGARLGHNQTAFRGGFRLWNLDDIQTLDSDGGVEPPSNPEVRQWRVL